MVIVTGHRRAVREIIADQLADPEFRAYWERTALARAVALRVIAYRAEHGLSQTALGRRLGMSQPAVARLEAGERQPTLDTLVRLSEALGIEFLVDIRPASEQTAWVAAAAETARVVEDVTTANGSRVLVAVS
jgi:transcriptional regulator with XRE-family HTH domain